MSVAWTEQRENYLHRNKAIINHMHYLLESSRSLFLSFPVFFSLLSLIIILYRSSTFSSCAPFLRSMHTVSFIINTFFINSDISWERRTQPCKLTHMFAHTRWHTHTRTHTSWIIKAMCRGTDRAGDDLFGQAGRHG